VLRHRLWPLGIALGDVDLKLRPVGRRHQHRNAAGVHVGDLDDLPAIDPAAGVKVAEQRPHRRTRSVLTALEVVRQEHAGACRRHHSAGGHGHLDEASPALRHA
jgi:hypothetical protein